MQREEARILSIAIRWLTPRMRSVLELKELREFSAQDFQARPQRSRKTQSALPTLPATPLSALAVHFDQSSKVQVNNDRRNWFRPLGPQLLFAY
jgi:hypothetical protein